LNWEILKHQTQNVKYKMERRFVAEIAQLTSWAFFLCLSSRLRLLRRKLANVSAMISLE
jgi:hypothetical protein